MIEYKNVLDKFFEADNLGTRGASGTAGSAYQDYYIPAGEDWIIEEMGGSASIDQTEIELLYSTDSGATWINPFDVTASKIRSIHLQNGTVGSVGGLRLYFFGGMGGKLLRLKSKNYNSANTA